FLGEHIGPTAILSGGVTTGMRITMEGATGPLLTWMHSTGVRTACTFALAGAASRYAVVGIDSVSNDAELFVRLVASALNGALERIDAKSQQHTLQSAVDLKDRLLAQATDALFK